MACCGNKCSKYILVAFIIMLMFIGIVIVAAAADDMNAIIMGHGGLRPLCCVEIDAFMIAVGVFIIMVATFGCYSLWKESSRLLNKFACCIIVIICLELSLGIATAIQRSKMETTISKRISLSYFFSRSGLKEHVIHVESWDYLQRTMKCCGSSGDKDYNEVLPSVQPPFSCCTLNKTDTRPTEVQRAECLREKKYHKTGCVVKLMSKIHRAGNYVIYGGIVFSLFEMIGFIGMAFNWLHV